MKTNRIHVLLILLLVFSGFAFSKSSKKVKKFSSVRLIKNKYRFLKLYNEYIKRKRVAYNRGKKVSIIIRASTKHILESKNITKRNYLKTQTKRDSKITINTSIYGNTFVKAEKSILKKGDLKINLFGLSGDGMELPFNTLSTKKTTAIFYPGISILSSKNNMEISLIGSFDNDFSYLSLKKGKKLNLGSIHINTEFFFEALSFHKNFSYESLFSTLLNLTYYPFYIKAKIPIYSIEKIDNERFLKRKTILGGVYLFEWLSIYGGYYETGFEYRKGIVGISTKF